MTALDDYAARLRQISTPQPVEIVRPKRRPAQLVGALVGQIAALFYRAWIVMLFAPVVWQPVSYGWAVAAVLIVGSLRGADMGYREWTRDAR